MLIIAPLRNRRCVIRERLPGELLHVGREVIPADAHTQVRARHGGGVLAEPLRVERLLARADGVEASVLGSRSSLAQRGGTMV